MAKTPERWLITGASGKLGRWVLWSLGSQHSTLQILALSGRSEGSIYGHSLEPLDLADQDGIGARVQEWRPTHCLHLGGITSIAEALQDSRRTRQVNAEATGRLAREVDAVGGAFVFTSTDMVFGGDSAPYDESATPRPLSAYGESKLAAEELALESQGRVARVALMYGTRPGDDLASEPLVETLERGRSLSLFTDEFRTPISYRDAARALIGLARAEEAPPLVHLGGPERLSRFELGCRIAGHAGVEDPALEPASRTAFPAPEPRPEDLSLASHLFVRSFPELAPQTVEDALPPRD